jgi:hypothetical protein
MSGHITKKNVEVATKINCLYKWFLWKRSRLVMCAVGARIRITYGIQKLFGDIQNHVRKKPCILTTNQCFIWILNNYPKIVQPKAILVTPIITFLYFSYQLWNIFSIWTSIIAAFMFYLQKTNDLGFLNNRKFLHK